MSKVIAVLNHWEVKTLQRVYLHLQEYQETNRVDYIFTHKLWKPFFIISYNEKTKDIYLKAKNIEEKDKEDFLIVSPNDSDLYYWIKQMYREEFYEIY